MPPPQFNFNRYQQQHFIKFRAFRHTMPIYHCTICTKMLYPNEVHLRARNTYEVLNTSQLWQLEESSVVSVEGDMFVVCALHKNQNRDPPFPLRYPGPNIDRYLQAREFTYRERSALSPIKLMSQVTRGASRTRNFCGYYEQTGTIWTEHNLEFTQMLYGGMIGSPIISAMMTPINQDKVQEVFQILQTIHPHLATYNQPEVRADSERHALRKLHQLGQTGRADMEWFNNYVVNLETLDPMAANFDLDDLQIGVDSCEDDVRYRDLSMVLTLIFPYLYTEGVGYYSLHSQLNDIHETQGGLGVDNRYLTIAKYARIMVQSADRRFGRCTEFLFFILDYIERKNIHSYKRFVLPINPNRQYLRGDVYRDGAYITDTTSTVPHTIRSSRAYKKKHGLNLFVSSARMDFVIFN